MWLPLAEAGDAKAQYNIGRCYNNGDGVDKDAKKALEWYLKAAAQGDPRAHNNIALWYEDAKDDAQAATWRAKAAELGEPRALYASGYRLLESGQTEKAREYFQRAANEGNEWGAIGLIACDLKILISHGEEELSSSYVAPVVNGNGGGTRTSSFKIPTVVFTVKNNSSMPADVTLRLQTYDFDNPDKRIGDDQELRLPLLQPEQESEVINKVFHAEKQKTRIYLVGYSIKNSQLKESFQLPNRILAWEWEPKKSGCFVLTACYEDYDAPTVFAFRQFRDKHLQRYWLGKKFITWYYSQGPKMAAFISDKPRMKNILRAVFNQLVKILPR